MQFLNPIWFFAAFALAIPLVIHLWNIKPGRVLKVGSVSLISETSRKSSRSFKFTDIPLLILRCLFLLLLAALLAAPWLQQKLNSKRSAGWVLIPKAEFDAAYAHYKKPIDSLIAKDYEFHFFNDSLPKADVAQLLKQKNSTATAHESDHLVDYWVLIKQLDNKVAADIPVYLFTPNAARYFTGNKPQANLNLHWQTYTAADSNVQWLQSAWFNNDKTISLVKGTSNPTGISFEHTALRAGNKNAQFTVQVQNGMATAKLTGQREEMNVDTSAVNIAIFTDHFSADAAYLKAALEAAGQFSQRHYLIRTYSNAAAIPHHQSWVFWLSEQGIPLSLSSQNVKIFAYQAGRTAAIATSLNQTDAFALPDGDGQTSVFKTIAAANQGETIWRDGYGNALLSAAQQNHATVYHFYSRFNPTYNDLVWNSSFPQVMLQLVFGGAEKDVSTFDRRTLTGSQLMPVKTNAKNIVAEKFSIKKDLSFYLWLVLFILFIAERWLATSTKTVPING